MKKLLFLTLLSLIMVIAPFKQINSLAAQSNPSIQDCIDNPKLCDDNTKKQTQQDLTAVKSSNLTFFDYVKMIFSFAIVIGLLYLVLNWIKRNGTSFNKNNLVTSLGGTSIGSNKSVQLIKIGNAIYVVGVGEDVTLLKEITNSDEIQTIEEKIEQKNQSDMKVTKLFGNAMKFDSKQLGSTKDSFKNLFNQQIQSIKGKKNSILTRIDEKGIDKNE
jgi:flagellar protein FliO/FliZ